MNKNRLHCVCFDYIFVLNFLPRKFISIGKTQFDDDQIEQVYKNAYTDKENIDFTALKFLRKEIHKVSSQVFV